MYRSWLTLVSLLLAALCGLPTLPVAAQTPINSYAAVQLGGVNTVAYGINDSGQIAGASRFGIYPNQHDHAMIWQNNVFTDLVHLGRIVPVFSPGFDRCHNRCIFLEEAMHCVDANSWLSIWKRACD